MVFFLQLIGTMAFAISGADVGIRKKMDLFGVSILAMTTAVGGGILRDIILNISPPSAFREPVFTFTSIGVGIVAFVMVRHPVSPRRKTFCDAVLNTMDSIGLGLFTVVGVETAFVHVQDSNIYLAIFVGVITGVGGGVMRDILSGSSPTIFMKHFYACASLIGAVVCVVLWFRIGAISSMLIGTASVVVLRNLAAHYRWSLPKISNHEEVLKTTY